MPVSHEATDKKGWLPVMLAVALVFSGMHLPAVVRAAEPAGAPADAPDEARAEQRMLELNEAGFSAFAEGEFVEAARKFEEAHEFVPDPNLRKNAAIAWFKAERCEEASEAAVFFLLADEMTVKDRIEARSVLGHCRLDEAEAAIAAGDVERARLIVERVALLETDERVEERLSSVRVQLGPPMGQGEGVARVDESNTAGWALLATGAAIVAGTAGYHILSARQGDADTASWLVPSLYGAGAVTASTGVWLIVSDQTASPNAGSQEAAKPAAQKAPAPSVQVGMTFKF
ncbi:hypothetical protein FIV42_19370 [Persicimonas caeni]|uniref:Tetratricopeptide repeat protein n=1 Tax=Persicimonas caeni TaxID=2292766 RepID=A0A4Y6PWZ2_PERCE|nr:hypothetical protein [Persicimonas caeni]QDG52826.1 hypothetical protein FIV42_19370 [Persicimonas caeni]QED34048.1 hypothetical protein FRD00_19365 [Persicimonas caeni]